MKFCPKCARSYAEIFTFCPNDRTELLHYELLDEFQSLNNLQFILPTTNLYQRLKKELGDAWRELRHNPITYLHGVLRGDGSTGRRKKLIQTGLATGVSVYALILIAAFLWKEKSSTTSANKSHMDDSLVFVEMIPVSPKDDRRQPAKKNGKGALGGSKREPSISLGGGSHNDKTPASIGQMPIPSFQQQINLPDLSKSKIPNPTLVVQETIFADPAYLRRVETQIGVPDGPDTPSLGDKGGSGLDSGNGPGYGDGRKGNVGKDGEFKTGGGRPSGSGDPGTGIVFEDLKPTILLKQKAPYTEEARQNGTQGVVTLSVVFGADGVIKDIKIIHMLPHGLTQSAIEAARKIRFQPAIKQGKPVNVRSKLEYRFNIY